MESIIKHYQVAHVGFSLSYPDSSQEMMSVLLEAYQAFECDEQVASAALTSFSLTLNESGEELRKPAFWFLLAPSARSRLSDPSRQPLTPR